MSFTKRPAEYSYQTGSPVTDTTRNKDLQSDYVKQIKDLTGKLPGNVQEHIRRQREINRVMGQTELVLNRAGNPARTFK